jgi:hypothetical protein
MWRALLHLTPTQRAATHVVKLVVLVTAFAWVIEGEPKMTQAAVVVGS